MRNIAGIRKPLKKPSSIHDRLRPVEGRNNSVVKELRRAFLDGDLTLDGHCAIEGMRIIEEAIRSGLKFRVVFFRESSANRAERLLPQLAAHVETLLLPDKLFASAVPSESPQGVAALVKCKAFTLDDVIACASSGPLVCVAGVQDPGNLGTILRSAEAFGAGGALLGEGTASVFNSKVIRASAGSVFRLPISKAKLAEVVPQLKSQGLRLVATSSHKSKPLSEATLDGRFAIFIGSEGAGVPRELLVKMDENVAIPHSPNVESLNAGVAASIVLYEISRRKS